MHGYCNPDAELQYYVRLFRNCSNGASFVVLYKYTKSCLPKVGVWGRPPPKIKPPPKNQNVFSNTGFNVDVDFVIKNDLAQWHRQVADVGS